MNRSAHDIETLDQFLAFFDNMLYLSVVTISSVGYGSMMNPMSENNYIVIYLYMMILGNFFYAYIFSKTIELIDTLSQFFKYDEKRNEHDEALIWGVVRHGTGFQATYLIEQLSVYMQFMNTNQMKKLRN